MKALRQRGALVLGTLLLAGLALLAVLLLALATLWYSFDLPSLDKATEYRPRQHLTVLAADGSEIAQFGSERRVFVPIEAMPKALKDAVLATEDSQFYEHGGISWKGVLRAAWANVSGGVPQGASTITQQVARTFFLSTRRTAERKIKEALIARQLESELSKNQILELYLNQIYLGQRAYGFGAAAETYFGRPLAELGLPELALLAGLPQNPIYANPFANEAAALRRQQWVLARLLRTGQIDQATHDAAREAKLVFRTRRGPDMPAQHVAEMARRLVFEQIGERAYTEGIRVMTSLMPAEQRAAHAGLRRALIAHERRQRWRGPEDRETLPPPDAEAAAIDRAAALALRDQRDDDDLRAAIVLTASERELTAKLASGEIVSVSGEGLRLVRAALKPGAPAALAVNRGAVIRLLEEPRARGATAWAVVQWPEADGAYVSLDPATGRVRALVGGFSFARGPFNRATQARRQPGSAFKPLLYAAAFPAGVMPETLVDDTPLTNPDGSTPSWNPKNSDGRFDGPISLREGLVRSKNLVSVRLLQHVGLAAVHDKLAAFGLDPKRHPQDLTLALGSGSVSPMEMATAYGVFANGGRRVAPVLIERVVAADGRVLFEAPLVLPLEQAPQAIPARDAFLVNSLMQDVTARGTAARAQATLKRPDLFGKTGTTNDAVDAWFAGWAPGVVGVAWIGHDEPKSLGDRESGGGLALPVWIDAMAAALKGVPVQTLVAPEGLSWVDGGGQGDPYNGGSGGSFGEPPGGTPLVPGTPATPATPERAGDWRYTEWAQGGFVPALGEIARRIFGGDVASFGAAAASAPPR